VIYTIKKGKHKSKPRQLGYWMGRNKFRWKILFTPSCRYNLQSVDQLDVNKLVGIGYLPGHHKHSARFGWCYNPTTDLIELSAYCYINGKRIIKRITECAVDKEYKIELFINEWCYFLSCSAADSSGLNYEVKIEHKHRKEFQYRLGTFFGGNRVAPHEIKIKIDRA